MYKDVTTNHWPVCGCYPVPCKNKCGKTIERKNLEIHIADVCPKTIIDCEFKYVGCDVTLPRKDMSAHIKERVVEHLSLHAMSYKAVVDNLKKENERLKVAVAQLTSDLRLQQICTPICPTTIIMDDFEQHKEHDDEWYSSPFYTHPKGYKMCIMVNANSIDEYDSTHTAVGVCLMEGEFDNQLKWPLRGHITIRLLSQEDDQYVETKLSYTDIIIGNRVLLKEEEDKEDIVEIGPRCVDFISHTELQQKYLKNNCLRLCAYKYEPL
jgi:TNF receptor-associated factor 4